MQLFGPPAKDTNVHGVDGQERDYIANECQIVRHAPRTFLEAPAQVNRRSRTYFLAVARVPECPMELRYSPRRKLEP
jgi:hypothetical protein